MNFNFNHNPSFLNHVTVFSIYFLYVFSTLIVADRETLGAKSNDNILGASKNISQQQQVNQEQVETTSPQQLANPEQLQKPQCNVKLNKITGNVYSLQHDDTTTLRMSLMKTRILVNYGQYIAYPREDGSFEVDNLPSDSYVVEVTHPRYIYEPARVDITSKGKIRARRVNYLQPSLVQTIDYPLRFRPKSIHNYFIPRETWRIMDLLFNPMVIMMVVPLVIIWLLPKMMNPQEVQTQRDNMQMPEYNFDFSEMMARKFGGQAGSQIGAGSSGGSSQTGGAITSGSGGGGTNKHSKKRR